ncbi:DUF4365 domain-containing protein [Mucilaginibacter gynuensis]|uniref:DUF4365 domain-containing protein n=1 Tax=Mucilaginibacter gynuensis TaxID=1302236 RepID=A0ABP8GBB9_9SPHI
MSNSSRITLKNEATGLRVVSQIVQEFWECGWQPYEHRNDRGIDGLVILRKRGIDLGIKMNVQIKCGPSYISSKDENFIYISIHDSQSLLQHLDYWKIQSEPVILIFVNPCIECRDKFGNLLKDNYGKVIWKENRANAIAWWVDLKADDLLKTNTKTIVKINKKNRFGEHSKGELIRLSQRQVGPIGLQSIRAHASSLALYNSVSLRQEAKQFYNQWKINPITCQAINEDVIIARTGWRHILHKRRTKERRIISLRYLGFARDIIANAEQSYLLSQSEDYLQTEQKIGLRATIITRNNGEMNVQVILLRRINKSTGISRCWFFSVHNR